MLERDLTSKNGLLAKSLPKGFYWYRIADVGYKTRNKTGFDGLLFFHNTCWPVEVKLNSGKLNENEIKTADEFKDRGIDCLILTYQEKLNIWVIDFYGKNYYISGKLYEILERLVE